MKSAYQSSVWTSAVRRALPLASNQSMVARKRRRVGSSNSSKVSAAGLRRREAVTAVDMRRILAGASRQPLTPNVHIGTELPKTGVTDVPGSEEGSGRAEGRTRRRRVSAAAAHSRWRSPCTMPSCWRPERAIRRELIGRSKANRRRTSRLGTPAATELCCRSDRDLLPTGFSPDWGFAVTRPRGRLASAGRGAPTPEAQSRSVEDPTPTHGCGRVGDNRVITEHPASHWT